MWDTHALIVLINLSKTCPMTTQLTLSVIEEEVSICRLEPCESIPSWAHNCVFSSITRTQDELSIVCFSESVPRELDAERGWRILKLEGPFELSLIGILSGVANVLKENAISLFVVSTFDTDYVLVKKESLAEAITALRNGGYRINLPVDKA